MVGEIRGAKKIQNYPLKIRVRKIRGGWNYASKYCILCGRTREILVLNLAVHLVTRGL